MLLVEMLCQYSNEDKLFRLDTAEYTDEVSLWFQVKTRLMNMHMSSPAFCEIIQ